MKFSTSKIELQKALQKVSKATPTRSTLPILSCVLIKVESEKTILRSTDLEITIQVHLVSSYERQGEFLEKIPLLGEYISQPFKDAADAARQLKLENEGMSKRRYRRIDR